MERIPPRRPRHHFETGTQPSHVTFDDGRTERLNLPWAHFVSARWEYAEPDVLKVTVGDFLVVLTGSNLAPLFLALEERTLLRVRAQPQLSDDHDREADTFVAEIRIVPLPAPKPAAARQGALPLL